MKDKMTSGEIAKKAGISQKAVRLYDEKGLLKPSDYSEGNYRLYDHEALLVLEKIIALKQIGFTLEEIRDNLIENNDADILATLEAQSELMEAKIYELERINTRIKAAIARSNGKTDWDDVAEVLKSMYEDQNCDDWHFFALDHTKDEPDWYVKIYRSLNVKGGERVLDLGCGFAKVWRNNWDDIPAGVHIDGYDLRGSWADDFNKFVKDNEDKLAEGSEVKLYFEDIEDDTTWSHIESEEKYSMILAHYLADELKNVENVIEKASKMLSDDGVMSLNSYGTFPEARLKWWILTFKELGIDSKGLEEELAGGYERKKACVNVLNKYFSEINEVVIPCNFLYSDVGELCDDFVNCVTEHMSYYDGNLSKIREKLDFLFSGGTVSVPHDGNFWRLKIK